jgi:hypothetical protein
LISNRVQTRFLFSCLLVAAGTLSMAHTVVISPGATDVSTTVVPLTSVMINCGEGWTGIPFTGKVQINVSSSSGPFDLYIFTQWEGRGQQVFDSTVCSSRHPTSTSQNCGIVNTPPQCVFARAQVFNGSYDVNLPLSMGSYYYIVFVQCCSTSVVGSTVTVIMRGTSQLGSSFNQYYSSSISLYYVSSLNLTFKQNSVSSFNITPYMSLTPRTNMTFPSMHDIAAPFSMPQLPEISQLPNTLLQLVPNIAPAVVLFVGIELIVLAVLTKPYKHGKRSKTSTKNCADCGRELSSKSTIWLLSWDYCRVCQRKVCVHCLERFHNDRCELHRFP